MLYSLPRQPILVNPTWARKLQENQNPAHPATCDPAYPCSKFAILLIPDLKAELAEIRHSWRHGRHIFHLLIFQFFESILISGLNQIFQAFDIF